MTALGCGKTHGEFRDVFSFTTRGVGFAMVRSRPARLLLFSFNADYVPLQRASFKTSVLSPAERELASSRIDQHLRLYLPSPSFPTPSFPTPSSTPDLASAVVKQEPTQAALGLPRMPSPHSLGDGLDEAAASTSSAAGPALQPHVAADVHDGDVEMAETQLHEDVDEPTQLHEEERSSAKGPARSKGPAGRLDGNEGEDEEDEVDKVVLVAVQRVKTEPVEARRAL